MKTEQIQEFEEIDSIFFYQGRIAQENQLKTQDLDRCKFLDFMEIGQPVPVVLEESPVLYSYIMWIHNKINPYARVETTISAVKGSQISVTYSVRGAKAKVPPLHTVLRSARDVSILYSAEDLLVNTREHFSSMRE